MSDGARNATRHITGTQHKSGINKEKKGRKREQGFPFLMKYTAAFPIVEASYPLWSSNNAIRVKFCTDWQEFAAAEVHAGLAGPVAEAELSN